MWRREVSRGAKDDGGSSELLRWPNKTVVGEEQRLPRQSYSIC